jgi:hypothetical protein
VCAGPGCVAAEVTATAQGCEQTARGSHGGRPRENCWGCVELPQAQRSAGCACQQGRSSADRARRRRRARCDPRHRRRGSASGGSPAAIQARRTRARTRHLERCQRQRRKAESASSGRSSDSARPHSGLTGTHLALPARLPSGSAPAGGSADACAIAQQARPAPPPAAVPPPPAARAPPARGCATLARRRCAARGGLYSRPDL